jgi:hypothetical protein
MIKELKETKATMRKMRSKSFMTFPWTNIWRQCPIGPRSPKAPGL